MPFFLFFHNFFFQLFIFKLKKQKLLSYCLQKISINNFFWPKKTLNLRSDPPNERNIEKKKRRFSESPFSGEQNMTKKIIKKYVGPILRLAHLNLLIFEFV